jgi:hypothetical protein
VSQLVIEKVPSHYCIHAVMEQADAQFFGPLQAEAGLFNQLLVA